MQIKVLIKVEFIAEAFLLFYFYYSQISTLTSIIHSYFTNLHFNLQLLSFQLVSHILRY